MSRSTPLPVRALALVFAAGASCWSVGALAQTTASQPATQPATAQPAQPAAQSTPPATDDTLRLTDEQRLAIIDNNTPERAAARGELTGSGVGRGIHGEVSAMIGTHGTRGVAGVAEIPLGNNGSAVVSFESTRFGYRR